jgi:hypothetical protein
MPNLEKRYYDILDKMGDKIYDFYNLSGRKDLVMVYEMKKEMIYSYVYAEFLQDLNEHSKEILKLQYESAQESGQIVLFIKDEEMRKMKSFVI